jgi:hypothetical protein
LENYFFHSKLKLANLPHLHFYFLHQLFNLHFELHIAFLNFLHFEQHISCLDFLKLKIIFIIQIQITLKNDLNSFLFILIVIMSYKNNESNKGKKWSNEEISDLTNEFINKISISEIAASHKRSEKAIKC